MKLVFVAADVGSGGMTNYEIRNPKEVRSPNDETLLRQAGIWQSHLEKQRFLPVKTEMVSGFSDAS